MNLTSLMLAALLTTAAQPAPPPPPQPPQPPGAPAAPRPPLPPDPLRGALFPPELVMGHQGEIGLTEQQRQQLIDEIGSTQAQFVKMQFEVQAAQEQLATLVRPTKPDEAKVMAQSDKLMQLESKIKAAHLRLLVRIKNVLTPAQQEKLRALEH